VYRTGLVLCYLARIVRRRAAGLLFWAILIGLSSAPGLAQILSAPERAQLEAQKQQLFQQMLRNPADLDTTFAYADVAAKLGDNEAALAALDRMLLFNPNLPRVQLEVGVLYFRMGAFELARTYFDKALAASPPPEVRERVEFYLSHSTVRATPEQFSGYLFSGVQYQSDANVAPGSPLIHSPIGDVLLGSQFVKKADVNIFGAGVGLYTYDLGTQNGDALEILGTGFGNHYFRVSRLDLLLGEVTAGPRFNFPDPMPEVSAASVKPYAILNNVGLGGSEYFFTYGAGIEGTAAVWDDLRVRGVFEFRQKKFSNASDRPLSTGLDGNDKLVSLQFAKPVALLAYPGLLLQELNLQLDFLDQDTRFAFYSNKSYGIGGGYRVRFDDPTGYFKLPWETAVYAGRIWSNYDAPDPCCSTSGDPLFFSPSARFDRRWRFGVSEIVQVADNAALVFQFQRDIVSSNLSLYAYTSNSVLVGPQIRF
jgi:hypothetical protein